MDTPKPRTTPMLNTKSVYVSLLLIVSLSSQADIPQPDAGSIMREIKPEALQPQKDNPPLEIVTPKPTAQPDSAKIRLKTWRITGNTLFNNETLQSLIADYCNKELTLADLRQAALTLDQYYQQHGYYSHTLLPAQDIKDGLVELIVLEGRLGKIEVDAASNPYANNRISNTLQSGQAIQDYLKLADIQRGILLLNDLPGGRVEATLKPGTNSGEADLNLKIKPANLASGSVDYANAGLRAVGENQFGGTLHINNPLQIGDLANFRLQGGSDNIYGRFAYSLPIGYSGFRLGVQTSALDYSLGHPFQSLQANGSSRTGGIFFNYPIIRGLNQNLFLTGGFDEKRYYNTSLGTVISDKELQVGNIGLNGDYRDLLLSTSALNQYSFNLSTGHLDLSGDPIDAAINSTTAKAAGIYEKFALRYSRLQNLAPKFRFYAAINSQIAAKNLDSSEKFSLGGPYAVRAYPVNEGLGEQGYVLNFELRYDAFENFELIGFIDHGATTIHAKPWAGLNTSVPNQYSLSGGGIGFNWRVTDNFMIKGSMAERIGSNPGQSAAGYDSDGTHKTPHFWINISKAF